MPLKLHNTLSNRLETFEPRDPNRVTMYVCGPTVYNFAHIGNARPPVVFDVLYRLLSSRYSNVIYARNITDVDDKINDAARELGVPIGAITARFTEAYRADTGALGVRTPSLEPHATEHIGPIIAMCEALIARGHAYAADGHVLFDTASFADYGQLSNRSLDDMIAGARVEVASYKKNPADFVLWKPSTPDLPGWDSPWGRGRPGWHIECSAMIATHLGETIDIHGGGVDLTFPHHENEIAQSACAHGQPLARYWLHNGFVTVDKRKMSKSLGNVQLISELRERFKPEALRYWLLSAHYRQPLDFSESAMTQATRTLDRLYAALRGLDHRSIAASAPPPAVVDALDDDLNTPKALAALIESVGELSAITDSEMRRAKLAEINAAAVLLGLLEQDPEAWFASGDLNFRAEIDALVEARVAAKKARDFATADRIRNELTARGIALEDSATGTRWRLTEPA
jgi:cysteinyl-tRNA synthetase